jgi:hypothetical protein
MLSFKTLYENGCDVGVSEGEKEHVGNLLGKALA